MGCDRITRLLTCECPCFNSRTPCGVRQLVLRSSLPSVHVSIHAPHVGRDCAISLDMRARLVFQFTHPVWGATPDPQEGGGRFFKFQFTHPMWGATISQRHIICHSLVSIHAPQWGATRVSTSETTEPNSFNSRTPCGVRLDWITSQTPRSCFNSRTPCGVRLYGQLHNGRKEQVSIHAPHVGCDQYSTTTTRAGYMFQFTHPMWGATSSSSRTPRRDSVFQFTHPMWGATYQSCPP